MFDWIDDYWGGVFLCNLNLRIACDDGDVFLPQEIGDWESGSLRTIDQQNMRIETWLWINTY